MKLTIRHHQEIWREPIAIETQRQAVKLQKLLKRFSPDLVRLQGDVRKDPRKKAYLFSVNLTLPTGTLHATGRGAEVRASVKTAFAEIEAQIKKHMSMLRKDHEWKRKRQHIKVST